MDKIAIGITTFLRDDILKECIESILNVYQDNWIILVADQGKLTDKKTEYFKNCPKFVKYYNIPFDSGVSYSRNFLVNEANKLKCPYFLLGADSIHFNSTTKKINDLLGSFDKIPDCGIIGINLLNRVPWEYDIDLVKGKYFSLKKPTTFKDFQDGIGKLTICDMVKNFFIAKTETLLDVKWDEELKLCEHEDEFFRLKQSKWKVAWTDYCSGKYVDFKPEEYNQFRKRMYNIYRSKLKQKYSISGWVYYEK